MLIEDVPARACESCEEQYYDEDTSAKILTLANIGFPTEKATRQLVVPVFSIRYVVVPHSEECSLPDEYLP